MHSRSKSTTSLTPSPKKRIPLGRADSNRSGNSDFTAGRLPSVAMATKEAHASTNAFYAQLLEAQKMREEKTGAETGKTRDPYEMTRSQRARSEEQITALPLRSPRLSDNVDPGQASITMTPRKTRPEGLQLVPQSTEETVPTERALIEARKQRKIMTMLATDVPQTPPAVSFKNDTTTFTYDSTGSVSRKQVGSTSPKKKFLGLNISVPSFMSGSTNGQAIPSSTEGHPPLPPPPPPAFKKPLGAYQHAVRKDTGPGDESLRREDAVSHLPEKIRQLRQRPETLGAVNDSPTLGRSDRLMSTRAVSDQVTSAAHSTSYASAHQEQNEMVRRSKSVLHPRDADAETTPPTPLPKDTPPKVTVQQSTPIKSNPGRLAADAASSDEQPTPVKGGRHVRNNYLELIHKSPSVYSLYGDIQHLPSSQSADVIGSNNTVKDKIKELETLKPSAYGGRWSDGQVPAWKERDEHLQEQLRQSPPRSAPAAYFPSVYSTIWPPSDVQNQRVQAVQSDSHPQKADRGKLLIHPSLESSRTLIFGASNSVVDSAEKDEQPVQQEEHEDPKATMTVDKYESLLPSRELASSPSVNVTMPTVHSESAVYKLEDPTSTNGEASAVNSHLNSSSTNTEASPNGHFRDSMSINDYYPPEVAQYPNAMPTPLFGRHGQKFGPSTAISPPLSFPSMLPTPPPGYPDSTMMHASGGRAMVMMPDGSNVLTHFDVLNRHIMDAAVSLHQAQGVTRDQLQAEMSNEHAAHQATSDLHHSTMKESFEKVEKQLGANSMNTEAILAKLDRLVEVVCVEITAKMGQLAEQNTQILSRFDTMQRQVADLDKKYDDSRSFIASEVVRMLQSNLTPYYQSSLSMAQPQSLPGQVMFMDPTTRLFAYGTSQAQHASPMHGGGQTMYGGVTMQTAKEEKGRRSDEFGGYQRYSGYGGDHHGRRGYDSFRRGSDPRPHDSKHYNDSSTSHHRHS